MIRAYYNENDSYVAQWLRNLIAADLIAPGDVDDRSIADIEPDDLRGYAQCHFFAGISVWSYALRAIGWPDDRPIWTGSCPCQPFSDAGEGKGEEDARHLWPVWFELIRECRPARIVGEQVASKSALRWWDTVQDNLESETYACAAADLCAPGAGAYHIRQRLFWVADAERDGQYRRGDERSRWRLEPTDGGRVGGLAIAHGRDAGPEGIQRSGQYGQQSKDGGASGLDIAARFGHGTDGVEPLERWRQCAVGSPGGARAIEWIYCTDGKYRPIKPGIFPLAHGVTGRVAKLRAIGNSIFAPLAIEFLRVLP